MFYHILGFFFYVFVIFVFFSRVNKTIFVECSEIRQLLYSLLFMSNIDFRRPTYISYISSAVNLKTVRRLMQIPEILRRGKTL